MTIHYYYQLDGSVYTVKDGILYQAPLYENGTYDDDDFTEVLYMDEDLRATILRQPNFRVPLH